MGNLRPLGAERWWVLAFLLPSLIGPALFQTQYGGKWTLTMAASLISVAPISIAFFLAQRHFIRGIAMSGFK